MFLRFPIILIFTILCLLSNIFFVPSGLCIDNSGEAEFDLGVFAYEDKDYVSAEKHLKTALSYAPDNPFYCHFLGRIYIATSNLNLAQHYLNKAHQINPVLNGLAYDIAYLAFKQKKFKDAAKQFSYIAEKDPFTKNVLACYYAGISFFECKKYSKASLYLMRAAERSPTIKPNCLFYNGICYLKKNKVKKAIQNFEYVIEHTKSDELKGYAKKWLSSIRSQKEKKYPFDFLIKISAQHDDNVMIVSPDWITGDESDYGMQIYTAGQYTFELQNNSSIDLGLRHYQNFHKELSEYDLIGSTIDMTYKCKYQLIAIGFNYSPSAFWLERSRYMTRNQFKTDLSWKVTDKIISRFAYSYLIQDNYKNRQRDGHNHDISMDFFFNINENQTRLFASLEAEENHRSAIRYQYEQLKFKLNFTKMLLYNLKSNIKIEISKKRHEQWNEVGLKRKDAKYSFSCGLFKPFYYKGLEIGIDYNYAKNNSSLDPYDYRRNILGLNLLYSY